MYFRKRIRDILNCIILFKSFASIDFFPDAIASTQQLAPSNVTEKLNLANRSPTCSAGIWRTISRTKERAALTLQNWTRTVRSARSNATRRASTLAGTFQCELAHSARARSLRRTVGKMRREEKRASRLWTPFTANRGYYPGTLRRARHTIYAVTCRRGGL